MHLEALDDRSRPSEWTIRPHAHAELNHIFHIRKGGGAMRAEHRLLSFGAPCLLIVPAGIIHGFSWISESMGSVTTASTAYLHHLKGCDPALASLFDAPGVCELDQQESSAFAAATDELMAELGWSALGSKAAVEAGLLRLLVRALRARGYAPSESSRRVRGGDAVLVARFREQIESRFRQREPIAVYAAVLHATETRLRAACAKVAGQSPMQILDQRAMLESQRSLLYSNLSIAEIGHNLGFEDAAYFSRFFARHAGISPRAFRSMHAHGDVGGA